jgi:hypothetical protein
VKQQGLSQTGDKKEAAEKEGAEKGRSRKKEGVEKGRSRKKEGVEKGRSRKSTVIPSEAFFAESRDLGPNVEPGAPCLAAFARRGDFVNVEPTFLSAALDLDFDFTEV